MGEEEKKEEKPKEEAPPQPPPPPEEVVMRVYMHCEGCARKVKKILKRFDGVEDVIADPKAHNVVVKGKKAAADPMKVVERVRKKTGRKVDLLLPIPPLVEEKKEEEKEEPEPPKPEEKKEPPMITVMLKVHMHCEACAQEIKKRILKMKGVQSAEPDLKASEVAVKGVFDEAKLAEYVHKRTGKHAAIVKSEPVAAPEKAGDGDAKDEKMDDKEKNKDGKDGGGDDKKEEKEKAGDSNGASEENEQGSENDHAAITAENLYMHYPQFAFPAGYYPSPAPGYIYPPLGQIYAYAPPPPSAYPPPYAPHIFSDENPHACSVM